MLALKYFSGSQVVCFVLHIRAPGLQVTAMCWGQRAELLEAQEFRCRPAPEAAFLSIDENSPSFNSPSWVKGQGPRMSPVGSRHLRLHTPGKPQTHSEPIDGVRRCGPSSSEL